MSDTDVRWRAKKVIQDQSNRLVTDTQIKRWDNKTDPGHTHTKTDITDFPSSMPASDVKAWAKADNKPSYVWNEIGNKPTEFNPSSHKHSKNDITDFPESIKNPLSMSIMLNGGNTEGKDLFTYDGSIAKTVNINYSNIGAAPKEHYHDDRYYTEEETDKLIKGVSTGVFENLTWEKILNKPTVFTPANHTHSKSEINDFPDSLKNPSSITIKLNGGTIEGNNVFTYDGSITKTIDITAVDIGASSIGHIHTVKDIKDFPISMPASDVYDWAKEKFKPSYVWSEIGEKPTEFNPIAHKHVVNEITDFPEAMRNPYSISIRLNNGTTEDLDLFTYNGDGEKSINITPIKIDAADRVHTHTRSQITDFPETLRNPAFLTVKFDNMANKSVTSDSYDGSVAKTITVASNIHKHLKEDILDFPDSIKNPKNITLVLDNGETTTQDFYDGSEAKTFNVASAKHTHSKTDFTDFPVSIKNPFSVTIVTNDGKTTASDSYDGSTAKTFNLASAKHVHVKSEITDFPDSIKNPSAVTIITDNGETTSKDTYDGSLSKTFNLASGKHVHVKSEITDFPNSIKNPTAITITMNDGTDITKDSYDGSEAKTFDVAKGKHVHVKSEITDFPDSIKNPTAITIITNDGKDISQDSYDGSEGKIFEVADAKHVHVKSEITDFPDSIKNPTAITISLNDGKTTVSDSYDGSKEKSFNAASAKHVHVKSEITDFPTSIKNPASITIAVDDGKTKTQDSYDGSSAKKFDVANAKHVHVKSEITDFPTSIKNPNTLIVNINDGKTSTQTKYDGSVIATVNVASSKHVHTKSEITDFPTSFKNPSAITISTYNGTDTVSDSYDGSSAKTFNVASANHTHSRFHIVDFPDSIKNPTTLIVNMSDGKNTTTDSYDGSEEKTLNLATAKHVHVKSEITDFPASIKNPTAITITMNDGKTTVSDSYDGSTAKTFDVAKGKHVHVKSEITDFPSSIKNPTAITITMNDGKNTTKDSYDGSTAKTFDVAKGKHVHVKSEITDFPDSIKNPTSITISLSDGKNTTTDSYDGSKEKSFNAASAKHVHVKSEITDFPTSIKNPTAITISVNDGKTTVSDSYDGSSAKKFDVAKGKHVHVKSEITDFPSSIKNPTSLSIQLNGGAATVYDGSAAKSINITPAGIGASANTHLHDDRYYTESEIDTKLSNINTTLTSHNHTELAGVASPQAVPGKSKDGFMTYHYNVNNGLANNMPSSNNANAILTISRHAGDYTTQLGFSSDDNIYYRNGVGTTSWKRILDSSNYNSYAPTKTGTGASGTWGINISGKANTAGVADSANAVAWGNISGKPSTYTPSSHTHTKSQITDFPSSIKNPNSVVIKLNGGTTEGTNMFTYDGSAAKSINITPAGIGAAASSHTHNYAGSSSSGGSANSAVKLDTTSAGSATQPVYFSGGKPVACTYTLGKSVPSNAVFTDTNTWRGIQNNLTSDSTNDSLSAAQGKVLKGLVDGKAAASHTHTKSQITDFPSSLPASDVYSWAKAKTKPSYAWSEITGKPSTFTPSSHTHTKSQITDFPTSMPASDVYSWAKASSKPSYSWNEISSKPSTFTPSSHTHNYAGSSSAGGSANSAVKLNTNAGSKLNPIYFSDGKPAACTYTLAKSVPSDAVFTDTNTWRGIQNNLTSNSTSDSLSAAQGKVLKGLIDGKASSSHTHSYLPLSGGNVTGRITRSSGGAWISQRDLAIVYQSLTDSSSACPVVAFKTKSGAWAMGSLAGTENLYFSYSTDSDYNAGNNNANMISLPAKSGTIALTSDLPTWSSIKPTTTGFAGIAFDDNGAYIYGENNSGNIFFRYKASKDATDYSWGNIKDIASAAYGNHRHNQNTLDFTAETHFTLSGTYTDPLYGVGTAIKATGGIAADTMYTNNWFRSKGNTGWYSQDYGGGWYMQDTTWIRSYNDKSLYTGGGTIRSDGGFLGIRGNLSEINVEVVNTSCDIRLAAAASEKAGLYDVKSGSWVIYVYKSYGKVNFDSHVQATGIYNNTTSGSANIRIAGDGDVMRINSASKYKINIKDIQKDFGYEYNLLKVKPRQWLDKSETEQYAKYLTDLYDNNLDREKIDYRENAIGVNNYYGLIAEDIEKAGLGEFCEYGPIKDDGTKELEGIQYDRLPILMIPILRDLVSCMNKILPYAKKGIDDENTLKEVELLEKRFNCFKDIDVINTEYDPETSKVIE